MAKTKMPQITKEQKAELLDGTLPTDELITWIKDNNLKYVSFNRLIMAAFKGEITFIPF